MTSVPKPLKFLRPHFAPLKETHKALSADAAWDDVRKDFADILSVLAMTMGAVEECESLKVTCF